MAFGTFSVLCNHQHCPVPEHFHHPQRNPRKPSSSHIPPSSRPWQQVISFLSPWIYLFYIFYIKGIIHRGAFLAAASYNLIFLRVIHVVACVSSSLVFTAQQPYVVWLYLSLFIHLPVRGNLAFSHLLAIRNIARMNVSYTSFCLNTCFQFFWVYTQEQNCQVITVILRLTFS